MELWYTEKLTDNVNFSIKIKKQIFSGKSQYQQIDFFDSDEFGRFFTLDGLIMATEKDEFIYHEMIVHVPMATNPDIKRVLVIGAGDGGTVRELTRYDTIESIDMVEIDKMVVDACIKYFQQTSCRLGDPRVTIFYEDGLKFVRNIFNEYDLIIVDSTDPIGPGEGLFTKEFYGNCYEALNEKGILVNQHESPYYSEDAEAMKKAHKRIKDIFPISKVYQAHIPTYASGHWLFGFASKEYDPILDHKINRWNEFSIKTRYYNPELHKGCFALPTYVNELLASV